MRRFWIVALVLAIPTGALAADASSADPYDRLPQKYWEFMDGYKYQYAPDCTVVWSIRTASFLVPTTCPELSNETLKADAIKSIKYVQARSGAKSFHEYYEANSVKGHPASAPYSIDQSRADAIDLWRRACLNAKSLNFVPFVDMAKQYPGLDLIHAGHLFYNANQTVKGLGGMVNCAEQAGYAVSVYTSDIDIRAKDKR